MNDKARATEGCDEAPSERAGQLRARMVDDLMAEGTIVSARVAAAMRAVPRELFVPGADLAEVYRLFGSVLTTRDAARRALGPAPQVQAHLLERAEVSEGMRVLEIGSGGYTAALLAELVGPSGQVTTVGVGRESVGRAGHLLGEAGCPQVNVVFADAELGVPEHAPYDRILVTVDARDVPQAWVSQLAPDGRLVLPLQVKGLSRTIVFERAQSHLVSRSSGLSGFLPLPDACAQEEGRLALRCGEVTVHFDDGPAADRDALEAAFDTPRVEVWSGATIGRFEPWASAQMWLATELPGFCHIELDRSRDSGLISPPGSRPTAMAVVSGANLGYVTTRNTVRTMDVEFGVHAFGPEATTLAEQVAEQLRVWQWLHRTGPGPQLRVYPAGTPDDLLPEGRVVDRRHSRITISWPQPVPRAARRPCLR